MAIKSFSIDEETYRKFSGFCKENGINMSKQVEFMMQSIVEEEPEVRKEYLEKLDRIRAGKFIRVKNFADRYGLKE